MGAEPTVFDGNDRVRHVGGQLLEPDGLAAGVAPVGDQRAAGGDYFHIWRAGRNLPFGGRRQIGGVVADEANREYAGPDAKHAAPVKSAFEEPGRTRTHPGTEISFAGGGPSASAAALSGLAGVPAGGLLLRRFPIGCFLAGFRWCFFRSWRSFLHRRRRSAIPRRRAQVEHAAAIVTEDRLDPLCAFRLACHGTRTSRTDHRHLCRWSPQ